ncbi:bactofilin family protein [Chromohalobacter israelensis]|uniref:bactofilin family protein n=1 Tax=Chromohalobacter israelensis TaxID=141390 RepID=UPI003AF9CFAE
MFSKHKPDSVPADHTVPPPASPKSTAQADGSRDKTGRTAIIGAQTSIKGNVLGEEELVIDGQVAGTVEFKHNTVSIGNTGRVEGDIYAQTLHVAGHVEGRLIASHKISIHHTAYIVGTIITPCLVLEDGAVFQGSIDMDAENEVLLSAFEGEGDKSTSHRAQDQEDTMDDFEGADATTPTSEEDIYHRDKS